MDLACRPPPNDVSMIKSKRTSLVSVIATVMGALLFPLACTRHTASVLPAWQEAYQAEGRRVTLDGVLDEWPEHTIALADGDYIYLRVQSRDEINLQGSGQRLFIQLDVDCDLRTGQSTRLPILAPTRVLVPAIGADLELEFSPLPQLAAMREELAAVRSQLGRIEQLLEGRPEA